MLPRARKTTWPKNWTSWGSTHCCATGWWFSSSNYWSKTAHQGTAPTSLSHSRMTQLRWVSSAMEKQITGTKWVTWPCGATEDNVSLNANRTMEIVVDFSMLLWVAVVRVNNSKFLGVHITKEFSWNNNTSSLVDQCLSFLRKLRSPQHALNPRTRNSNWRRALST